MREVISTTGGECEPTTLDIGLKLSFCFLPYRHHACWFLGQRDSTCPIESLFYVLMKKELLYKCHDTSSPTISSPATSTQLTFYPRYLQPTISAPSPYKFCYKSMPPHPQITAPSTNVWGKVAGVKFPMTAVQTFGNKQCALYVLVISSLASHPVWKLVDDGTYGRKGRKAQICSRLVVKGCLHELWLSKYAAWVYLCTSQLFYP